jgi:hypothetical protein
MQSHHVGEIAGGDVDAPGGPVEKAHIVTAVARQEHRAGGGLSDFN